MIYQVCKAELYCDQCQGLVARVQSNKGFLDSIETAKLICVSCEPKDFE